MIITSYRCKNGVWGVEHNEVSLFSREGIYHIYAGYYVKYSWYKTLLEIKLDDIDIWWQDFSYNFWEYFKKKEK